MPEVVRERCVYCGALLRPGRTLACAEHADLPALEPDVQVTDEEQRLIRALFRLVA